MSGAAVLPVPPSTKPSSALSQDQSIVQVADFAGTSRRVAVLGPRYEVDFRLRATRALRITIGMEVSKRANAAGWRMRRDRTRRPARIRIPVYGVVALSAIVIPVSACSGGSSKPEQRASSAARKHIHELGIEIERSSCGQAGNPDEFSCDLKAANGATISVAISKTPDGEFQYETTAGIIDGRYTAQRLGTELGKRFRGKVTVNCPDAIPANTEDVFTCQASTEGPESTTRDVSITVLDDRTGDFTYQVS